MSPAASPTESWLLLDLGAVLPVERVSWELGFSGALPPFELWLSDDGVTWWNVAQVNGWELAPGVVYETRVDAAARYVMIVVPEVAGLGTVGGIGEVRVWPAGEAGSLDAAGSLVTPEPAEPSVTEEPAVEESATEATEPELAPDQVQPGAAPEETSDETPPPQT